LKRMHAGHPGQEKSLKLAQALFYWPGMNNEIRNFVSTCKHCFRQLPSQVTNPVSTSPPSENYGPPMSQIGLDLFEDWTYSNLTRSNILYVSIGGQDFRYTDY